MSAIPPAPAPASVVPDVLADFNALVDGCKRVNYQGHAFYHPVSKIKEWMLAGNNLGKLLARAYPNGFATTTAKDIQESVIVFAILLRLRCGDQIHIFQQYFKDSNLDASLPESLLSRLKGCQEVLEAFDKERWAFNPAKIEDMLNHSKAYTGGRWILPFCRRHRVGGGGTATVDGVNVPHDLVPEELKSTLLERDPKRGYEFDDRDFGLCYQFAVKSYSDENHSVFETEISNFNGIRGLAGVIACFGWYTEETLVEGERQTTHNILLEYGDQDLDEYLAINSPPILMSEIIDFWKNIFEVAATLNKFHTLPYERPDGSGVNFHGWHGDVKPSNILFAQGKFKLADFGFAKFEPKLPGKKPETSLDGVTLTYGAPECDPGRRREKTTTHQTQKIDTWSFGCLLSSVATWVVFGSDAYERQYPFFRKYAMEKLIHERKSDGGTFEEPKALDGFHDGCNVLQAVKTWHQYILDSTRRSDTVTRKVVKLIESHMLRSDPEERSSFEKLTEQLRSIIQNAKDKQNRLLPNDPELLKALLMLDDTAPPDVNLQARLTDKTVGHQPTGPGLQTKRPKKTERIEEMVVTTKVASRRKALESELLSQNQTYTPPCVIFEPIDGPSNSMITEAGEHEQDAPTSSTSPPPREWPPEMTPPATAVEEKIPAMMYSPEDLHESKFSSPRHAEKLPVVNEPPEVSETDKSLSPSQGRRLPATTHLRSPSQGQLSTSDYNRSRFSLPPALSTSTLASNIDDFSQYRIGQLRAELERQWSERGIFDKMRGKIPVDHVQANFVQGRDIKFVVDNGFRMLEHWTEAKFVLVTLAMKIGALDDDGLDLLFTRGGHKEQGIKGSQIRNKFEAAMDKVATLNSTQPSRSSTLLPTQMAGALRQVLKEYRKHPSKKLTMIILTTGMWEAEEDGSDDVEGLLAKEIGRLAEDPSFRRERRLTIEFVSFGEYPDGLKRLGSLDDHLSSKYGIPDVIDTEHWTGDPDKMLLGSINPALDREVTFPVDYGGHGEAADYYDDSRSSRLYRGPSPGAGPRNSTTSLSGRTFRRMFRSDTQG